MSKQFDPKTKRRGIEWTDKTVGVFGGCLHDCKWEMPDGTVAECYAKSLAESGVAKAAYPEGFEHHYFREKALTQLSGGERPELIFCDSMSDMFAANVPPEQIQRMFSTMRDAPHKAFQSLTKAAPQLLKFTDTMPPNLWVGVSSPPDWFMGKHLSQGQQEAMLRKSLEVLWEVRQRTGNIVWMSAEPVSWDLTAVIDDEHPLDWIVIGAASRGREYFQPEAVHVRNLLEVMDETATAVFYKGNIRPLFQTHDFGRSSLNRWREDFPARYRDGRLIEAVAERQRQCELHGWTKSGLPF